MILAVALYVLWTWVFFEHPAEITKKLSITSHELHRRRKELFRQSAKVIVRMGRINQT
jgi:hypothetical protein